MLRTIIDVESKKKYEKSLTSCGHITIDKSLEEEKAVDSPPEFEGGVEATVEELKKINLGTTDESVLST